MFFRKNIYSRNHNIVSIFYKTILFIYLKTIYKSKLSTISNDIGNKIIVNARVPKLFLLVLAGGLTNQSALFICQNKINRSYIYHRHSSIVRNNITMSIYIRFTIHFHGLVLNRIRSVFGYLDTVILEVCKSRI